MKKVLVLANHFITIYAFRRELIEKLLDSGYKVTLALPYSDDVSYFSDMGCEIIDTPLERRKTNPLNDLKLLFQYLRIIKNVKPDVLLTYTIKPNTYGGLAARICRAKAIHTVTGLGSVYIQDMWQKKIAAFLNKIAFKNSEAIFFLNDDNKEFYKRIGIIDSVQRTFMVPGSGVNLEKFKYQELELNNDITFTLVGRVLKDKGIEEFLSAAKRIKTKYPNTHFEVVGFVDEEKYVQMLNDYEKEGIIHYLGKRNDIPEIMSKSTCIVLPSYGEGRGTVLQEGAAIGRPLITCDIYGCRDNVEENKNGYLCKVADEESLVKCLDKFINISSDEKLLMGRYSRKKAEKEFDRNIVLNAYLNEIEKITDKKE
ncbi:glycosyltransferase family 4 protein [Clostridium formicaceticum]|uniref:N, N'-diacetylbacillosaminyl-diphospho-undecaprenol alpha-1,3-N-acetylgalactosaminyltransferase n=1 Tax=Clostridium formicaceticum TaxID=1497 RepID=A0AAC9RKF9_9CLOT|nr:glycosyltransferase family 4 protein [Clostridium formicaceticum]AOY75601.1 hypothetical protein BJL90_06670 [Clostridium formicaceticum]ARE85910.1 N,N'-diacetylbacillosaminyl-diphospho-undecaprenol alpha-1,3-N-acetylgalactosaminyltransferase [Clostridium formicaceticum]